MMAELGGGVRIPDPRRMLALMEGSEGADADEVR